MTFQEPNYTQVPNQITDEVMAALSGAEFKCIHLIIRQTFGYHRRSDNISHSYFMKKCGLSERGVINSIQSLEEKGVVKVKRFDDDKTSNEYTLEIKNTTALSSGGGLNSVQTQKKYLKKDSPICFGSFSFEEIEASRNLINKNNNRLKLSKLQIISLAQKYLHYEIYLAIERLKAKFYNGGFIPKNMEAAFEKSLKETRKTCNHLSKTGELEGVLKEHNLEEVFDINSK